MPESTPADSNASKDTQSTLFPPDSRVSGVSSNDDKHRHMCYCAMHLEPGESDEPSWTGGRPISNNDIDIARIHFGSDREPTIFESTCTRATIILSFRDDDLPEDEELVGYVTKSDLDEMGLWPMYRDVFKTATGVECGLLVEGEFVNMYEGDPIMEINRSVITDSDTFDDAGRKFWLSNTLKKELEGKYIIEESE